MRPGCGGDQEPRAVPIKGWHGPSNPSLPFERPELRLDLAPGLLAVCRAEAREHGVEAPNDSRSKRTHSAVLSKRTGASSASTCARADPGLIEHQLRRRAEPPFECRPPAVPGLGRFLPLLLRRLLVGDGIEQRSRRRSRPSSSPALGSGSCACPPPIPSTVLRQRGLGQQCSPQPAVNHAVDVQLTSGRTARSVTG
jgi:hypothetical protein